jgi:hypothetical protein
MRQAWSIFTNVIWIFIEKNSYHTSRYWSLSNDLTVLLQIINMTRMRKQKLAARKCVFTRPRPGFLLIESSKLDAVIADFVLADLIRKLATQG